MQYLRNNKRDKNISLTHHTHTCRPTCIYSDIKRVWTCIVKWSRALCHIKLNWVSEHCDSMDTACLCATHTRVDSVAKIWKSSCFWKDPEVLLSFSWGGQTVFILYFFWGTKVWSVKAFLAFSHNWPEWTESCVCPLVKFDKCFLFRLKLLK